MTTSLSILDIVHLLIAFAILLAAAHTFGYFFQRFRQPRVIGEIFGGMLLGPTCLKEVMPIWYHFVFVDNIPTQTVIQAVYQVGLFLLMFCSGTEIQSHFKKDEQKTVGFIVGLGIVVPLFSSFASVQFFDPTPYLGGAGSKTAFSIIFALAIAVTSIPVISRIFYDLGLLGTAFARIVLASAVIEDIFLYIMLAIALSVVNVENKESFGLSALLGIDPASGFDFIYHTVVTALFFLGALIYGPGFFRRADSFRYNLLQKSSPLAFLLLVMFFMVGIAIYLGIAPMLGAFMAGIVARSARGTTDTSHENIKAFSFAFFIPVYFSIVGLKLDLIHAFDFTFFLIFTLFACLIKVASVFYGSRLAGESPKGSLNFAIAMNARGGPGIVLASLAFDAQIINENFYTVLVMLSIVTSLLAGWWLDFVLRRGWELR